MKLASRISILLVTLWSVSTTTNAKKNYDVPHEHRGILNPFEPGPFEALKLDSSDEKVLESGKPVMKQTEGEDLGGGAICVQDVDAPKEAVWAQILSFASYKGKVPKVNECKNYKVQQNPDGTCTIKTKMVVGVIPGYSYTSFYDHTFSPENDSLTWTLDYDKTSDFDDVAGHWHLENHPKKADCTRLFYACDIKLKGSVPKPVVNFLSKTALKSATGWVKKESEKAPTGSIAPAFLSKAYQK